MLNPDITLLSDASGQWGCGALFRTQWFQYQCPEGMDKANITRSELIPIILAVATWGHEWSRKTVVAQCDNLTVVDVLNRGYGREPDIMHLMCCLFFFSAHFHFRLIAKHIPGKQNILVDALSRDHLSLFRSTVFLYFCSLHPQANSNPAIIPAPLIALLITNKPEWLSQDWTNLFADILKVLQPPQHRGVVTQQSEHVQIFASYSNYPCYHYQKKPFVIMLHFQLITMQLTNLSNVTSTESDTSRLLRACQTPRFPT